MSAATKLNSPAKTGAEARKILGPGGNRVRVLEEEKKKMEGTKKNLAPKSPMSGKKSKGDDVSAVKSLVSRKIVKGSGDLRKGAAKVVPDVGETVAPSPPPPVSGPVKRCDWITSFSEPVYTAFHDGKWGVPVYDEFKLFELFVLSLTLSELTWSAIVANRESFRRMFDNFDPLSVASIDEKDLLTLRKNGNSLLSEQKIRAIIENSKQVLKIRKEFGSFSNYCWQFLNHKPIRNGFRYARQVPTKTPKAEVISKDLLRRGFRGVGPTVVYSFMQVSGMVNDHLVSCFRYNGCNLSFIKMNAAEEELTVVSLQRQ